MAEKTDLNGLIVPGVVVALAVVFGKQIITGIKSLFGDSAEDIEKKKLIDSVVASNVFSPNYWQGKPGAQLITVAYADQLCKQIKDADKYFNDDEPAVYAVFKALKYKTQVSWLAYRFSLLYKKDLYGFLIGFLDTNEMAIIADIVSKLK